MSAQTKALPSRRRMVNAAARALHGEHKGRVSVGLELPTVAKWQDCRGCCRDAEIAVNAVETLWKESS